MKKYTFTEYRPAYVDCNELKQWGFDTTEELEVLLNNFKDDPKFFMFLQDISDYKDSMWVHLDHTLVMLGFKNGSSRVIGIVSPSCDLGFRNFIEKEN